MKPFKNQPYTNYYYHSKHMRRTRIRLYAGRTDYADRAISSYIPRHATKNIISAAIG